MSRKNRFEIEAKSNRRTSLCGVLALGAMLFSPIAPATADTLQISGTGLVRHCPCDFDPADDAEVDQGVLKPQATNTHYFVPVVFPRDGEEVCQFSMVYRDGNAADTMTATLNRKVMHINGPAFDPPVVMAQVKSGAGTPDTMRRASTANIKNSQINTANSFYFIEVKVPTINLEIVGFQIVVLPTCA